MLSIISSWKAHSGSNRNRNDKVRKRIGVEHTSLGVRKDPR